MVEMKDQKLPPLQIVDRANDQECPALQLPQQQEFLEISSRTKTLSEERLLTKMEAQIPIQIEAVQKINSPQNLPHQRRRGLYTKSSLMVSAVAELLDHSDPLCQIHWDKLEIQTKLMHQYREIWLLQLHIVIKEHKQSFNMASISNDNPIKLTLIIPISNSLCTNNGLCQPISVKDGHLPWFAVHHHFQRPHHRFLANQLFQPVTIGTS